MYRADSRDNKGSSRTSRFNNSSNRTSSRPSKFGANSIDNYSNSSSSSERPARSGGFTRQSSNRSSFGGSDSRGNSSRGEYSRSNSSYGGGNRTDSSDRPPIDRAPYGRSPRSFGESKSPARSSGSSSYSEGRSESSSSERPRTYGRSNQSYSRSSRGGFGGGRSSGGGFRGGRGGGGRYSRKSAMLDPQMYIKKATGKIIEEYIPKNKFADFNVDERLKQNIMDRKFDVPTPIQDQTIEHILEEKDVIGIANTGTGKTAAFLIPLINKVLKNRNQRVIIMVPTRELATQIEDEFRAFTPGLNLTATRCIGGESITKQIFFLKRKANFVIGTPGRLKDLVNRRELDLGAFRNIVLDEVDRMVDMGFIDDMKFLLAQLPEERHSLFFSATLSREVESLIQTFLRSPITISVKTGETAENVEQDIVKIERGQDKVEVLHDLLTAEGFDKVLIFVKTKREADRLENELYKRGFKSTSLHGDKSQYKRQQALDNFKKNRVNILVATDVAARGLDIPNVSHVINYDLPNTYEDYSHRIGRTGRANNKGIALTFVS